MPRTLYSILILFLLRLTLSYACTSSSSMCVCVCDAIKASFWKRRLSLSWEILLRSVVVSIDQKFFFFFSRPIKKKERKRKNDDDSVLCARHVRWGAVEAIRQAAAKTNENAAKSSVINCYPPSPPYQLDSTCTFPPLCRRLLSILLLPW